MSVALTEDQRDALQEVVNVGMGRAGSALSEILEDAFVKLSVPRIRILEFVQLPPALVEMIGHGGPVTAVRQSFQSELRGEAVVVFGEDGCQGLGDLMGYDDPLDSLAEREILLDVANILVGACVSHVFEQLGQRIGFSHPTLIGERIQIGSMLQAEDAPTWTHALLVEINFALEERSFTCHLFMLMPEESIERLGQALDAFIESF